MNQDALREKVKSLIEELAKLITRRETREEEEKNRDLPKANPSASEEQIVAFEKSIGHTLPTSYREFLKLYNGYKNILEHGEFYSLEDMQEGGRAYEDIQEFKEESIEYDEPELADVIVIGTHDPSGVYYYLDPKAVDEKSGEFKFGEYDTDAGSMLHGNFIEYLEGEVESLKKKENKE